MSNNTTPENRTILTALATQIHAGQVSLGATIGLAHHLAPAMDAAIKKLTGDATALAGSVANKGSQLVYRDCVAATADAVTALNALSDGSGKKWLEAYKKVLEGIHGKKANAGWEAGGFAHGTTRVPRNHAERLALLTAARAYLSAHAGYEASLPQATGPALAITSAAALALKGQMEAAQTLINNREGEQAACKTVRDADVDALYDEVSGTVAELHEVLAGDDARWEVFGLNIPANPNPPQGVTGFTLTAAGSGRELAQWNYAVRAEYYRLFLKIIGVDTDFVNVADPKDLEFTLKNLTPGTTIEAYVVPMSPGGAGPASATVSKVAGA